MSRESAHRCDLSSRVTSRAARLVRMRCDGNAPCRVALRRHAPLRRLRTPCALSLRAAARHPRDSAQRHRCAAPTEYEHMAAVWPAARDGRDVAMWPPRGSLRSLLSLTADRRTGRRRPLRCCSPSPSLVDVAALRWDAFRLCINQTHMLRAWPYRGRGGASRSLVTETGDLSQIPVSCPDLDGSKEDVLLLKTSFGTFHALSHGVELATCVCGVDLDAKEVSQQSCTKDRPASSGAGERAEYALVRSLWHRMDTALYQRWLRAAAAAGYEYESAEPKLRRA